MDLVWHRSNAWALNGRSAEFSLSARKRGSLASLFFIGLSMIPAEKQGGWSRIFIYLQLIARRSASSGLKNVSPVTYTYIYIFFFLLYLPFLLSSSRRDTPCSVPPKFLSHYQFFFCCFLRAEAKSPILSTPVSLLRGKKAARSNNSFCARAGENAPYKTEEMRARGWSWDKNSLRQQKRHAENYWMINER